MANDAACFLKGLDVTTEEMTSLEIQPDARKSLSDEEIARRVAHAIAVLCVHIQWKSVHNELIRAKETKNENTETMPRLRGYCG